MGGHFQAVEGKKGNMKIGIVLEHDGGIFHFPFLTRGLGIDPTDPH